MERRQFIKISIGAVVLGAPTGVYFSIEETNQSELNISSALNTLDKLSNKTLQSSGEWALYEIFNHCAQSIEYSMSQYPEHKSTVFKNTLGKLAFSIFSSKGKMTHGLAEVIPGAPSINSNTNTLIALKRLKQSFIDFQNYTGELAPHFAYGKLTKSDYEIAHIMHLNNHLQEIKIT